MHGEREAWVVKWGNRDLVAVEELILHARIRYSLNDLEYSPILPVMYEIDQAWHRISPHPIEVRPPQILHPKTKLNWHYASPSDLATSGIYTQKELENLRDHIMFPAEKAAVSTDAVASGS